MLIKANGSFLLEVNSEFLPSVTSPDKPPPLCSTSAVQEPRLILTHSKIKNIKKKKIHFICDVMCHVRNTETETLKFDIYHFRYMKHLKSQGE